MLMEVSDDPTSGEVRVLPSMRHGQCNERCMGMRMGMSQRFSRVLMERKKERKHRTQKDERKKI